METQGRVLSLLLWAFAGGGALSHAPLPPGSPQASACRRCHESIFATFTQTAHFRTSAEATPHSVRGRFALGQNRLDTRTPGVYFVMERQGDGFSQTGVDSIGGRTRTERVDLVVGSGRRGQSFLYWRNGLLFELPVSYLTQAQRWINSPGYPDGRIDFGRLIVPRCLECHATSFTLQADRGIMRYARNYVVGISCEKCHGDGRAHVTYHSTHPADTSGRFIVNPARFDRARKVDSCALCHSGPREPRKPAFAYRPGANLAEYFLPPSPADVPTADVHGNQAGLLQQSKCFRSSADMTCSTCHDVHAPQRDVASFAQKCLGCHDTKRHPMANEIGERLIPDCIDCHMPNRRSKAIQITAPKRHIALYFRSHAIGIYPEVSRVVLESTPKER